ncbi:MAG: SWIM zinc finger family protein, partial [Alphaproteobacteria bacterium]
MALPFTRTDIERELPEGAVRRGLVYQREGRVRKLERFDGGQGLRAEVRGGGAKPYVVNVEIDGEFGRGAMIIGTCSCPVGVDCKHVAAVLFEALAEEEARRPVPPPPPSQKSGPDQALSGMVGLWLQDLVRTATRASLPSGHAPAETTASQELVLYLLDVKPEIRLPRLAVVTAIVSRHLKSGAYAQGRQIGFDTLAGTTARYARPEDVVIAKLQLSGGYTPHHGQILNDATLSDILLGRMIETGRCHWQSRENPPLRPGTARRAGLTWHLADSGCQVPVIDTGEESLVALPTAAPWYVDTATWESGPLEFDQPRAVVGSLLRAPPLALDQVREVRTFLTRDVPQLELPAPDMDVEEKVLTLAPIPCLRFSSHQVPGYLLAYRSYRDTPEPTFQDLAQLSFEYSGVEIDPVTAPLEVRRAEGRQVLVMRRDTSAEQKALEKLRRLGLAPLGSEPPKSLPRQRITLRLLEPAGSENWPRLIHREVPRLREDGWKVTFQEDFRHQVIDADGDWQAEIREGEGQAGWWFSLDLGIEVEGQRVALLPILVSMLRRLRDPAAPGALEALASEGVLYAPVGKGRVVALPFERVRTILATLVELFDADSLSAEGRLDISLGEALGLAEIEAATRMRWLGGERLRQMATRVRNFQGIHAVPVPEGFGATLRPYQQDGLNWLQFLREYEFGGILADDMGL